MASLTYDFKESNTDDDTLLLIPALYSIVSFPDRGKEIVM